MKGLWIIVGVGVALLGLPASQADAALMTVSVQLAPGQTGQVNQTGDVVHLNVYAILDGTAGGTASDAIQVVQGFLMSSDGGLLGDLSFTVSSSFAGTGSQNGTQQTTLDADGDKDVGGLNVATNAGWIIARDGTSYVSTDANEMVLIGTATFTTTSADPQGMATTINWGYRYKPGTNTNIFKIADQVYPAEGNSSLVGTGQSVTIVGPIGAPEPATMAVLVLGGVAALFGRRTRRV